jgi:TPR repeat protein
MKLYYSIFAFTIMLFSFQSFVLAQDFKKGLAAYKVGDYDAALEEWRPVAEMGNASAQYKLGYMYKTGKGVPLDYGGAVKWYHFAAIQGNASAQSNLGFMYKTGKGVPQDFLQAYMWYELANISGHKDAEKWLHNLSRKMTSVDIEKAQAMASECISMSYKGCGW